MIPTTTRATFRAIAVAALLALPSYAFAAGAEACRLRVVSRARSTWCADYSHLVSLERI